MPPILNPLMPANLASKQRLYLDLMVCFARQAALYWDWQKYCPQILWNMVRFLHFPACGRWKERDFLTMINTINLIECGNQSLKQPYLKHQLSLTHENPSDGAFTKCISPLIQILEGPAPSLGFLFGTFSCCYWAAPSVLGGVHLNDWESPCRP